MKPRTFITLFLAAVITSISATLTPLAGNNMNVFAQATTIPMLPGTTPPINIAIPGNGNSDPGIGELLAACLITKLQDVLTAGNDSNTATACDSLIPFINARQAQSGKKLTAGEAQQLVESATQVKSDLGCNNNKGESK